ncbi:type II iodothyronine deiodinase-like [Ptychodera flava]|uniref:type II iodothyronine deiodinase-like n=1 Tax=Ptychodera flava TaxID=63121 RepID=UPI00396A0B4A
MRAILVSGLLKKLYEDFKDRVDIYMVYVIEAHPEGSQNQLGPHYSKCKQHQGIEDRIDAAKMLVEIDREHETFTRDIKDASKVRIVLDNMDNDFHKSFDVFPDRVVVIEDKKLAYHGRRIDEQLSDNVLIADELRAWFERRFSVNK